VAVGASYQVLTSNMAILGEIGCQKGRVTVRCRGRDLYSELAVPAVPLSKVQNE